MNEIMGTKPAGWKWNCLLDAVVTILKCNKSIIYHAIYIKVFYEGIVFYSKFYTDDVLSTTNKETEYHEIRSVFE